MNIKILFDNQAVKGFQCGWGFSALVDNTTLFDTGSNTKSLLANLEAFSAKPEAIDRVVLSHEHWDHTGGIGIIKQCGPIEVYIPAAFSNRFKEHIRTLNPEASLVEVKTFTEIDSAIAVTGELGLMIKEIALAVKTGEGVVALVGCSHPGVEKLMHDAAKFGNLIAVIGGFHGFSKLEALSDLALIVPTHCTQRKNQIKQMYPQKTRFIGAGDEIDL